MTTVASTNQTSVAINAIEGLAKVYRECRDTVQERLDSINDEVRAIHRRKIPGLKTAVAAAADAKAKLAGAIDTNRALFISPRTLTLHGIKFGLKKGSGRIDWECDDEVIIKRIKREFADEPGTIDLLVVQTEVLQKAALKDLDASVLAKLGAKIEGVGDVIVIRSEDTQVDKLVAKLLKEEEPEAVSAK